MNSTLSPIPPAQIIGCETIPPIRPVPIGQLPPLPLCTAVNPSEVGQQTLPHSPSSAPSHVITRELRHDLSSTTTQRWHTLDEQQSPEIAHRIYVVARAPNWRKQDVAQWVVVGRRHPTAIEIGSTVILLDSCSREYTGITTCLHKIRAMEQDYVTFYMSDHRERPFELSVPILWTCLAPHRRLEYTILYNSLPSVIASLYPPIHAYQTEAMDIKSQQNSALTQSNAVPQLKFRFYDHLRAD